MDCFVDLMFIAFSTHPFKRDYDFAFLFLFFIYKLFFTVVTK